MLISRHSFESSSSIDKIKGFSIIEKYPKISCFLAKEERNIPMKLSSFKKFSVFIPPIDKISFSNNLYIKISNSFCSGLGINIFS